MATEFTPKRMSTSSSNIVEGCDGCGIYVGPAAIRNSTIKTAANVSSNIIKNMKWGVGFWKGSDPALGFTLIQGNMINGSTRGAIMAVTSTEPPTNGTRTEDDGRDYGTLDNGLYIGKPYPVVKIGLNYAFRPAPPASKSSDLRRHLAENPMNCRNWVVPPPRLERGTSRSTI